MLANQYWAAIYKYIKERSKDSFYLGIGTMRPIDHSSILLHFNQQVIHFLDCVRGSYNCNFPDYVTSANNNFNKFPSKCYFNKIY